MHAYLLGLFMGVRDDKQRYSTHMHDGIQVFKGIAQLWLAGIWYAVPTVNECLNAVHAYIQHMDAADD